MSLTMLVVLLIVAGVCGAIGQSIVGYSHMGCLGTIAVGFVGAYLGSWLAGALHLPEIFTIRIGGETFPVIWSIVGSALFVALISAISGRYWRYREV
jgi:uncharacterized membrane protein YeaQ/YmgE (transglycosylase-associated protein family)